MAGAPAGADEGEGFGLMSYAPQVLDDGRLAGRVKRYHTWPYIKEQSVAEHSWQLLRILCVIWPNVPAHVMKYVVDHDCGELTTGDAPFPVKRDNPVLANEMNRVEQEGLDLQIARGFLAPSPLISDMERWAVKLAEFIEMWEWALEEEMMGNRFARLVATRCEAAIWDRIGRDTVLTDWQFEIAKQAKEYVRRRKATWEI